MQVDFGNLRWSVKGTLARTGVFLLAIGSIALGLSYLLSGLLSVSYSFAWAVSFCLLVPGFAYFFALMNGGFAAEQYTNQKDRSDIVVDMALTMLVSAIPWAVPILAVLVLGFEDGSLLRVVGAIISVTVGRWYFERRNTGFFNLAADR